MQMKTSPRCWSLSTLYNIKYQSIFTQKSSFSSSLQQPKFNLLSHWIVIQHYFFYCFNAFSEAHNLICCWQRHRNKRIILKKNNRNHVLTAPIFPFKVKRICKIEIGIWIIEMNCYHKNIFYLHSHAPYT